MTTSPPADVRERRTTVVGQLMIAKLNHDVDTLVSLYHPDCVLEQPSLGVRSVGHAAIRPSLERFTRHFPDYQRDFEGWAFTDDAVVSWGRARVTLTGAFGGVTASGRRAEVMTLVSFRFAGDLIVHEGHYWDLATICRAAGVPVAAVFAGPAS